MSAPRTARLDQRAGDAEGEKHRPAAEVADEVERRHRRVLGADCLQRAGQRDVVDVVAGGPGQRPFLAPAGDAAEDEAGIAREANLRAEAEALHHAGAEALDQRVGAGDEFERRGDRLRLLQVEGDRAAAAIEKGAALERLERVALAGRRAVDAHDVGPHVGEQHAGERRRPDAGHFDDLDARQRTHERPSRFRRHQRAGCERGMQGLSSPAQSPGAQRPHSADYPAKQQRLYFLPLPQGHGSLRPTPRSGLT